MEHIDEIIFKYGEGLSKDLKKILEEVALEGFIKGKNVTLSELLTVKQLAERLGIKIARAGTILRKANEEHGIGFQLGRDWLILESEVELLRPAQKAGRPPSTYALNLKMNKSLEKIIVDKAAILSSEAEKNITFNDLVCQILKEILSTEPDFYSPEFEFPNGKNITVSVTLGSRIGHLLTGTIARLSSKFDKKITKQDLILQVLYKKFWAKEQNNLFIDIIDNIDDR